MRKLFTIVDLTWYPLQLRLKLRYCFKFRDLFYTRLANSAVDPNRIGENCHPVSNLALDHNRIGENCNPVSKSTLDHNRIGENCFPVSNLADRKSTRLNSSHVAISYAVFCLKKKIRCAHLREASATR